MYINRALGSGTGSRTYKRPTMRWFDNIKRKLIEGIFLFVYFSWRKMKDSLSIGANLSKNLNNAV